MALLLLLLQIPTTRPLLGSSLATPPKDLHSPKKSLTVVAGAAALVDIASSTDIAPSHVSVVKYVVK